MYKTERITETDKKKFKVPNTNTEELIAQHYDLFEITKLKRQG